MARESRQACKGKPVKGVCVSVARVLERELSAEARCDVECAAVECDSRKVSPGCAFAAIPGVENDGAAFAAEAVASGAKCIIAEKPLPRAGVPVFQVRDARRAWALLACAVAGDPSRAMRVWGVTGTNGKTTTAWTLAEMFRRSAPCGLVTTVETSWPGFSAESAHTTPDAGELQEMFSSMRASGAKRAVMEVSSHSTCQRRIDGTQFAGGIFTNLSEDHLDYHKTMESYFEAKTAFFRQVAELSPGAPAVVCAGGGWSGRMEREVRALGLECVTCGFAPDCAVRGENLEISGRGNKFDISAGGKSVRVECPLAGRYNAENVLCAAAAALCEGAALGEIAESIHALRPRWGRLEPVETKSPAAVFVDFAHTPDALEKVLAAAREFTRGKIHIVFGAGGDRDRAKRPLMGAACAEGADRLVVTSDNPRSENPADIIADIVRGIPEGTPFAVEPDRAAAIALAISSARAGDTVIIAGKGHERTQTFAGGTIPFDDRAAAMAAAERQAPEV